MTRLVAGALVAMVIAAPGVAAGAGGGTPNELTGSEPGDGASVAVAPERITLTFREPVDPDLAVIFVTGADGRLWRVGDISASGSALTMPVTASGPAGPCTISYRIASDDPIGGEVRFTLTAPVPGTPPTPSGGSADLDPITGEPGDSGGSPWVVVIVVGAVLFAVAAGVVVAGVTRGRGRP